MTLADYKGFKRRKPDPEPDETTEAGTSSTDSDSHGSHPGPLEYIQIGVALAIVTAVEVALFYIDLGTNVLVTLLLVLSGLKFLLVAMWFMHLKFDAGILTIMFVSGMALAFAIFMVAIATLGAGLL